MPRRGRKDNLGKVISDTRAPLRTTIVLPPIVATNLKCLSLIKGESMGATIIEAIRAHLIKNGLDPNKMPKSFSVTY